MTRQIKRQKRRKIEKKLGIKITPKLLPKDSNRLTPEQVLKLDKNVVIEDTFTSRMGYKINYKVTEQDILRREITSSVDTMRLLQSNSSFSQVIVELLTDLYGEFPQNQLKEVYFKFN